MSPRALQHLHTTALRQFLGVADHGSIAHAASQLHVAGSAISRQIAQLEHYLGIALFERHARGMTLTEAGEVLALWARRLATDADDTVLRIREFEGLQRGLVRIASVGGLASGFLPGVIGDFQAQHPGIRFEATVCESQDVIHRLAHGAADIGLAFTMRPERGVAVRASVPATVFAFVGPRHRLARRRSIGLPELARQRLSVHTPESTVRQLLDIACSQEMVRLEPVLETNNSALLFEFALTSGGLMVASFLSVGDRVARGELRCLAIRHPVLSARSLQLLTGSGRRPPPAGDAALAFVETRLHALAALAPDGVPG